MVDIQGIEVANRAGPAAVLAEKVRRPEAAGQGGAGQGGNRCRLIMAQVARAAMGCVRGC